MSSYLTGDHLFKQKGVLVKLIAKLPRIEFPKEIHQVNDDVSD